MSFNKTIKSAEDSIKGIMRISFQFYSQKYMNRPDTQEQIELLHDYLLATGFHGVRLKVEFNSWAPHRNSKVTRERELSSWGGKLWKSALRNWNRRDPSTISLFYSKKRGWETLIIGPVCFE